MNKLYRFYVSSLYETRYYYLKVTFYKKIVLKKIILIKIPYSNSTTNIVSEKLVFYSQKIKLKFVYLKNF